MQFERVEQPPKALNSLIEHSLREASHDNDTCMVIPMPISAITTVG